MASTRQDRGKFPLGKERVAVRPTSTKGKSLNEQALSIRGSRVYLVSGGTLTVFFIWIGFPALMASTRQERGNKWQ